MRRAASPAGGGSAGGCAFRADRSAAHLLGERQTLPLLHRDLARPSHICMSTGLGSPLPHLQGTGLACTASAPKRIMHSESQMQRAACSTDRPLPAAASGADGGVRAFLVRAQLQRRRLLPPARGCVLQHATRHVSCHMPRGTCLATCHGARTYEWTTFVATCSIPRTNTQHECRASLGHAARA